MMETLNVNVVAIISDTLGIVLETVESKLDKWEIRRLEIVHTISFLGTAKILRKIMKIWSDLLIVSKDRNKTCGVNRKQKIIKTKTTIWVVR